MERGGGWWGADRDQNPRSPCSELIADTKAGGKGMGVFFYGDYKTIPLFLQGLSRILNMDMPDPNRKMHLV